jgi:hypothetical protein
MDPGEISGIGALRVVVGVGVAGWVVVAVIARLGTRQGRRGEALDHVAAAGDVFGVGGLVGGAGGGLVGGAEVEVVAELLREAHFQGPDEVGVVGPEAGLGGVQVGLQGFAFAAAAQDLFLDGVEGVEGVVAQVGGPAGVGVGLVDVEAGGDLVLQAQLPGPGAGGVVAPEAAVGDAEGGVGLALRVDAAGPVARGEVGPVVVFAAGGRGQLAPPARGRRC